MGKYKKAAEEFEKLEASISSKLSKEVEAQRQVYVFSLLVRGSFARCIASILHGQSKNGNGSPVSFI